MQEQLPGCARAPSRSAGKRECRESTRMCEVTSPSIDNQHAAKQDSIQATRAVLSSLFLLFRRLLGEITLGFLPSVVKPEKS